jgi:hypothetical protein
MNLPTHQHCQNNYPHPHRITTKCTVGANVEFVRPCNITSSRNWIKHSPPLFGPSQWIHAPKKYFVRWMMALGTPSMEWRIDMKQWWNTYIHVKKELGIKKGLSLVPIFGLNICMTQFSFILNPLHLSPNQIELCTICIRKEAPTHVLK